uniref:Protein furry n=1 Tax=Syphacia muris TaxID=451379 RepID=A0A0N5A9H4_9BILA
MISVEDKNTDFVSHAHVDSTDRNDSSSRKHTMVELPWGSLRVVPTASTDYAMSPDQYSVKLLLQEVFAILDRKLKAIYEVESQEKNLIKTLQLSDDVYFENVLHTLHGICEHCFPTVLKAVIHWYEKQNEIPLEESNDEKVYSEKRQLAVNVLFCVILIEVLPQVHFFPDSCEQLIMHIVNMAFNEIVYRDPTTVGANYSNFLAVAEKFAEVLGVLSQSHSSLIQKTFLNLLNDLKKENPVNLFPVNNIIALLMAMKFFRVKTNQVVDFEKDIQFLDELGQYYLDVKHKDIKHATAGLLVEILLPVAAQIKTEANIPALISFVDKLYQPTFELVSKKRDKMAAYPLLTCLLCISQSRFFLANWTQFLNFTLASLKSKDPKVSRVALESLYRLVYVIRNNCEGNTATRNRLESICGSLFPKGNRAIIPRDAPLNIFVKIIHFIAQQKLDFAFKEVIFDLLGCNRAHSVLKTSIYPERMNIGIRALMVIANGLQQKEGPPDMPRSMATSSTQRLKKTYISRPLTADIARAIGLEQYYAPCRKAFDSILKALDAQIGKPLMITVVQSRGKEPEELLSGDIKPKLDLFRTCIAAIPRLLPDSMSHTDLVELLIRMSIHVDEELRMHSAQTLQTLMAEFADWREDIIHTVLNFFTNQIMDSFPNLLDMSLRLLYQIIYVWRTAVNAERKREVNENVDHEVKPSIVLKTQVSPLLNNSTALALHSVEGFALAMMCQYRTQTRKLAITILKEVRQLLPLVTLNQHNTPVIEVLDNATPYVISKYIEHVPLSERQFWNQDFASASDKIASIETDVCLVNSDRGNEYFQWDSWACALSGYCEHRFLMSQCPFAVFYAWPVLNIRLNACYSFVDPSNPQNESRASLLRSSKSKGTSSLCGESLGQDSYLSLWQKYLVMSCALAPPFPNSANSLSRSFSPSNAVETDVFRSWTSSVRGIPRASSISATSFYQKIVSMLKWEQVDMRDNVVLGIGSINPAAFENLLEEMKGVFREATDRKTDSNARRKRRKDLLRLQIIRLLQISTFRGVLPCSSCIEAEGGLCSALVDFIDSMRQSLESDQDRDVAVLTSLRLHFAKTIAMIINSIPIERRNNLLASDKKQSLFYLFTSWCSRSIANNDRRREGDIGTYVEQRAIEAMCALLCCGPIFERTKALGDDGYLYGWLETLLDSTNSVVEKLIEPTLSIMLDLNDETAPLLDWTIQVCYSKSAPIAAKCFRSLVTLFSKREYPCEFDSLFVLCQMLVADADFSVALPALELLHLLRRQFLDDSMVVSNFQPGVYNFSTNQTDICRLLARLYPKITMSVFSEVCARLENAHYSRRVALLTVLAAWIENIQLVDIHVEGNDASNLYVETGWGSEEATQLILNNLLYITATLSVDHSKELSLLWNTLASSYQCNLPILLNYLFIMASLASDTLLPHTKRICCFLMETCSSRLVEIMINHLKCVNEQFNLNIERCEMPPYYKWLSVTDFHEKENEPALEEDEKNVDDVNSFERRSIGSTTNLVKQNPPEDEVSTGIHQLPMPAYGGHYSMLLSLLPPTTQPIISFSRCNLALIHICDVIPCSKGIDWRDYIPILLHISVLGLDSLRTSLCRHSRQVIINIVLMFANEAIPAAQLANILLVNQMCHEEQVNIVCSEEGQTENIAKKETQSFSAAKYQEYRQMLLRSNMMFSSETDLVQAIIFCLSEKMDRPLWANEDVTVKTWRIDSAEQLGFLVRHLAEFMLTKSQSFAEGWSHLAMNMALSVSNRHIAGRCFQIASALCQSPTLWIPGVLSRLVETVGESHEDTQAYVTDLMLCLQHAVEHLALPPNVRSTQSPTHARSISYTPVLLRQTAISSLSSSVSPSQDKREIRHSVLISDEHDSILTGMSRSKSASALKTVECEVGLEDLSALCHLLSISVAMLESNSDNEYLLALNLLDKVLDVAGSDRNLCLQRFYKTVSQLEWSTFNGIISLIVKGTVMSGGYELAISILIKCLELIDEPAMGSRLLLPLMIICALPLLLHNFDCPTPLCLATAKAFAEFTMVKDCSDTNEDIDDPFRNFSSMMRQYAEHCFPRDRFQWAKCVVKYLCDALAPDTMQLFMLLVEMLERGTTGYQLCLLHCLYLLLCHGDLSKCSAAPFNAQDYEKSKSIVVRTVSKNLQGANWKEAARILKYIVQSKETVSCLNKGLKYENNLLDELDKIIGEYNTIDSPRKPVETVSLRKHANANQNKVRERLVSLLNASGLRVGLPKNASVIFSQSSHDIALEPLALSSTSSVERVQSNHGNELGSSSSLVADPSVTDSFPRVFREFDFLEAEHDSVSESTESAFNWLSTMRRRSISNVDLENEEHYNDDECSETAVCHRAPSAASDSLEVSSERTPVQSEARSESSEEEEESCDEDLEEDFEADASSYAGSMQGIRTEVFEDNMKSKTLPLYFECNHHSSTQNEHQWLSSFTEISKDDTGELIAQATLLFSQLFRECCVKVSGILRDASHLLTQQHRELASHFGYALDLVLRISDCPFLFVTGQFLRDYSLISKQKCILLELHEHYETFIERKELCIRALNAVKAMTKLMLIGGCSTSTSNNQFLELCKSIHKLFFQLLLISDKMNDMIKGVINTPSCQDADISPEILCLHRCLLASVPDTIHSSDSTLGLSLDPNSEPLLELLQKKQYKSALHTLRQLRQQYGAEFGCCDQVDVEVLLLTYCRSHLGSAFAIVGSYKALSVNCETLREAYIQMAALTRSLASETASFRSSRVSSVSEAYIRS